MNDAKQEVEMEQEITGGGRRLYFLRGTGRLVLRFYGMARGKVKAIVMILLRELQEFPRRFSCEGCKRFIGWLVITLLAKAAFALSLLFAAHLPPEAWAWLRDILGGGADAARQVAEFVQNLDPRLKWMLEQALAVTGDAIGAMDRFTTEVCRLLGFCPKTEGSLVAA